MISNMCAQIFFFLATNQHKQFLSLAKLKYPFEFCVKKNKCLLLLVKLGKKIDFISINSFYVKFIEITRREQ